MDNLSKKSHANKNKIPPDCRMLLTPASEGMCLFTFRKGGTPFPGVMTGRGVPLSQVRMGGGTTIPVQDMGYPILLIGGLPPSQLRTGGRLGVPPIQVRVENGGTPNCRSGWGYPRCSGQSQVRMGDTPKQNNIACTCYAAGGMPLAFTQDFLLYWEKVT